MALEKNIDSINEDIKKVIEEKELDLGHQEIIENYEYKEMFKDFIIALNPENKEKFLNILNNLPGEKLQEYLDESFEEDSEENGEYFFDEFEGDFYKIQSENTTKILEEDNQTLSSINQDVEEIITTISKFNNTDKSNEIIVSVYIKKLNQLKTINHNSTELKLIDENINLLNQYLTDIVKVEKQRENSTEKTETIKKQSVEAEKMKVEAEKMKVEAEKQKVEVEKIKNGHKFIKNNIQLFLEADPEFQSVFNELDKAIEANDSESHRKILEAYFSQPGKAKEFFSKLAEQNPEEYSKIYKKLSDFSSKIKETFEREKILPIPKIPKHAAYGKEGEKASYDGAKVMFGDKVIDFSTKPPLGYITLKNGFRLKTKITAPNTLGIRAKYNKKLKTYNKEAGTHKENITNLENSALNISKDIDQKKSRIEQINNSDVDQADKDKFIKSINEIITKNEESLERHTFFIKSEVSDINDLTKDFKIVQNNFEDAMYYAVKDAREKLLKGDDEVRNRVNFLDNTGFSIFPEEITNLIFDFIKKHKGIINMNMGGKTIGGRIDLSDGLFGGDKTTGKDSENNKRIFISLFNKMISGNPGDPIKEGTITTLLKKDNQSQGFTKASLVKSMKDSGVITNMGTFNISKIEENLLNSENEEQK